MAKKEEPKASKGKMTFIMFQLDGGDETLQQSFRTIGQALQNSFQRAKALPIKQLDGSEPPPEEIEAEVVEQLGEDIEESQGVPQNPQKTPKQRKAISYSLVKDLNFMPVGKQSLRDFFEEKGPTTLQEQVTVVLYYLTKVIGRSDVGTNHIYTALKDVSVPIPPDIGQTVRLTANRKGWIDSSKSDELKIAVGGENLVEHELPRKADE